MVSLEELKRLGEANRILNKRHQRLGIKPMYINNSLYAQETRSSKSYQDLKTKMLLRLGNFDNFFIKLSNKKIVTTLLPILILFSLLTLAFFWYQPKPSGGFFVSNNSNRKVLITSGTYTSLSQAKEAKKELSQIAGSSTLKIIEFGGFYTVQVGPKYKNYFDATMVFEELSKYPIDKLSIQLI